jgi:hypothetical protein
MAGSNKLKGQRTRKAINVKKAARDVAVKAVGGRVNKNRKITLGHTMMEPPT